MRRGPRQLSRHGADQLHGYAFRVFSGAVRHSFRQRSRSAFTRMRACSEARPGAEGRTGFSRDAGLFRQSNSHASPATEGTVPALAPIRTTSARREVRDTEPTCRQR